jgi:hypothetical protein
MRGPRIVQLLAFAAVVALTASALANRSDIGIKGMPVSIDSIVLCLVVSAITAYLAARGWHWLPAPLAAGIAGAIAGGRLGPTGGMFGFLVGLAVTVMVVAEARLASRGR